ncbi:MAG: hypothetical protein E6I65_08425 [Chloroflexi bacterium]|nr:MAG: hypothetical protein E6I65_08425 [Chloroflexota bacterium]
MTDQLPASGIPRPARRLAAVTPLLLVLAACSTAGPTGTPGPSAGPTTAPTPTVPAGIEHPTGAKDIVLRFEEGGGFVPIDFLATQAPSFTLYGDGTVVFRDPQAIPPEPVGNVNRSVPFQTISLGEAGIQALLEQGLGPGGLGIAVGPYMGLGADIPTAIFTVNANGRTKQVSVTGLSPDMHPNNAVIVGQLSRFADQLRTFGNGIVGEAVYQPTAYRGVLTKIDQVNGPVAAWPWPDVAPTDFLAGQNEFLMTRTMTPAEVAVLGIQGIEGGLIGLNVQKAGKAYSFALRPLLPDETS